MARRTFSPPTAPKIVFCHSSDEMYGADRILLDIARGLPPGVAAAAEFWLPDDLPHGANPLCKHLEALGLRVVHQPVAVVRRAYLNPRGLAQLTDRGRRTRRLLRLAAPDIVYLTTSAMFGLAPIARSAGIPKIVGHMQEPWTGADIKRLGLVARSCDSLIAISEAVASTLPQGLRDRCEVILNSTPDPGPPAAVPVDDSELKFVMAGRWNLIKGHETLFDAWNHLDSGELLLLGGPPPSGAAYDVHGHIARLRRPLSVRIVGEVPDPETYISEADVMIVPSLTPEGFGLVAIEAFALGRPVVASRCGGLVEIIEEGQTGWLATPGDSADLAKVLAARHRSEVAQAGLAARSSFERRFTAERYCREWNSALGLN